MIIPHVLEMFRRRTDGGYKSDASEMTDDDLIAAVRESNAVAREEKIVKSLEKFIASDNFPDDAKDRMMPMIPDVTMQMASILDGMSDKLGLPTTSDMLTQATQDLIKVFPSMYSSIIDGLNITSSAVPEKKEQ
jgi:hypothetical protein